jgi:hypothetical protein
MFKKYRQKRELRPKQKQRISYNRKIRYNWDIIESQNYQFGITRVKCYVDNNGYLRWKSNNKLCHRDIAFENIFKGGSYTSQFSFYDIHHQDGNKFNNNPDNLRVIIREEHEVEHGKVIYANGTKYIRLVPANRRRKQTKKAILIGGKRGEWFPKSQLLVRNGYLYAPEWIIKKKNFDR